MYIQQALSAATLESKTANSPSRTKELATILLISIWGEASMHGKNHEHEQWPFGDRPSGRLICSDIDAGEA